MTSNISRSISSAVVCLAAIVVPQVAAAESIAAVRAPVVEIEIGPDQARAQFAQEGLTVSAPVTWAMDKVTTFNVSRPSQSPFEPILTVLVYDDLQTAWLARAESEASGRPLVAGFGLATWQGNIAMVQSTLHDLGHYYQGQFESDYQTIIRTNDTVQAPAPALQAVDAQFVATLQMVVTPTL